MLTQVYDPTSKNTKVNLYLPLIITGLNLVNANNKILDRNANPLISNR
jgi:hypothetical protein